MLALCHFLAWVPVYTGMTVMSSEVLALPRLLKCNIKKHVFKVSIPGKLSESDSPGWDVSALKKTVCGCSWGLSGLGCEELKAYINPHKGVSGLMYSWTWCGREVSYNRLHHDYDRDHSLPQYVHVHEQFLLPLHHEYHQRCRRNSVSSQP